MIPLVLLLAAAGQGAFQQALPGYVYEFPRDHFAHSEFQIEWWYYTGNVRDPDGRRFGFELTFFRNALSSGEGSEGVWSADPIYLAHFALSDLEAGRFHKAERLNRAGPGLAGASVERALIWNGNWQAEWLDPEHPLGSQRLQAVADGFALELTLTPAKPAVIHGVDGASQKADGVGRASHYVSFTRLETQGAIRIEGREFHVEGAAWMDHEFSTNSMGPDQVGWDWMSAQLDDGSELMLYRLRAKDGSKDPNSAGTLVRADGSSEHLRAADFKMTPSEVWTSPETGGRYPLAWRVELPRLGWTLAATTRLEGQEIVAKPGRGPSYWEGAMDYQGEGLDGRKINGVGYLEMTGYDKPIELGVSAAGE